jgi:DNA repair exonuclease SbcCD ATPase subunit
MPSTTERDRLERRWRRELRRITKLAVRRYSLDDNDPQTRRTLRSCDRRLAAHRRALSDIEAALRSLPEVAR